MSSANKADKMKSYENDFWNMWIRNFQKKIFTFHGKPVNNLLIYSFFNEKLDIKYDSLG